MNTDSIVSFGPLQRSGWLLPSAKVI